MTESLLRQRRNLIITCVLLWMLKYGGVSFTKLSFAGFDIEFARPHVLTLSIWIAYAYFLYRYYLYFLSEGVTKLQSATENAINAKCAPIIRRLVRAKVPDWTEGTRQVITTVMTSGQISQEAEFQYLSGTRGALWLYNEEIVRYLDEEIWHKVVDLGTLQSELEGLPVGEERTKNVHAQRDIKKWLAKQLRVMERKFAPFLTLGH